MGSNVYPAAAGGLSVKKVQTFTSSGTFTLPSGYGASKPLIVDLIISGGGGGGGGGASNIAASNGFGGGGGGSGCVAFFNDIALTANATITIGAGGSGGAAGATNNSTSAGGTGGDGGVTNVNSLFYAPGGAGGLGGRSASTSQFGNNIRSYGFYIQGSGSGTNRNPGRGGSGGSAGAGSTDSSPSLTVHGGSYGYSPITGVQNVSPSSGGMQIQDIEYGGLGQNSHYPTSNYSATNAQLVFGNKNFNIRGGGGAGGGSLTDNQYGLGGSAGGYVGGISGAYTQTTGDRNGASATIPGGGGGGGGGSRIVAAGAGGNGGSGYVTIVWYE